MDDYGGPYREVFQLICDELQSPDPSSLSTPPTGSGLHDHQSSLNDNNKDIRAQTRGGEIAMSSLRHDLSTTPKPSDHLSTLSSAYRDETYTSTSILPTTPASNSHQRNTSSSLSSPPPQTTGVLPSVRESEGNVGTSGAGGGELNKRAVRCFLPLLHPTPNWSLTSTSTDCTERYRCRIPSQTHTPTTTNLHSKHQKHYLLPLSWL